MKQVIYAALFCSVLLSMGLLLGVYVAYFARQYAHEQVKASKRDRAEYSVIINDDGA